MSLSQEKRTAGTAAAPTYYDAPSGVDGDSSVRSRFFSYETDTGLVVGQTLNVMFTVDRPVADVWPSFQDFNRWQQGHYYSSALGDLYAREDRDLGDQTFSLTSKPNDPSAPHRYQVLKVVPEHLLALYQPVPAASAGSAAPPEAAAKNVFQALIAGETGGISPGFHVFVVNELGGRTVITGFMEHASRTTGMTEEEVLAQWRALAPEVCRKWLEDFIPALKELVDQAS